MPLSVDTIRCVAQHAMTHHNVYNVYFIFFKKMKCVIIKLFCCFFLRAVKQAE